MASTNIERTEKAQKMDANYPTADTKDARNYVFYGKAADHKLYFEPEYTTQVTQAVLENLMAIGAVLIKNGNETLVPVSITGNKVITLVGESATATAWTALATS